MDIDWSNIIPTLLGTLTGGLITWNVTKRSIEKQFEFEMDSKKIN